MIKKLVCFGDSLTEGYGLKEVECWVSKLNNEMDIEIINSGISGDTTLGMLARFESMVINHKPSHVIILGGTNDLMFSSTDEQILSNIVAMTRRARHEGIDSIVGLPPRVFPSHIVEESSFYLSIATLRNRLDVFRDKLKQFCEEDEMLYIDFGEGLKEEDYQDDDLHPNASGNKKMLESVREVLTKI